MSSIMGLPVILLFISYDIMCQWLVNFWRRMNDLPEHLQPTFGPENVRGKIPKFHFDAHGRKNHAQYSFNYTKGAGTTEGEGIERNWGAVKPGVGQTVEMGPGARKDVLDDFFGYANYRKSTDLGKSLFCVQLC